jgi:hypothetical protein
MINKGLAAGILFYVTLLMYIHDSGYLLSPIEYLVLSFSCLLIGEMLYPKE